MAYVQGTSGNDDLPPVAGQQNTMEGFDGNDTLSGGEYSDVLIGGEGDDLLIGNGGADIFVITAAEHPNSADYSFTATDHDTIADFDINSGDVIRLPFANTASSFEAHDVQLNQVGDDAVITFSGQKAGGYHYAYENTVTIVGVNVDDLSLNDFAFS